MKIYFTGEFSSRRAVTIATGLVLTMIGGYCAVIFVPQIIMHIALNRLMGSICASLFIVVFLGGGLFLLNKAARNAKTILMITSDGVSYGSKSYRWADITEIGVMHKYTRRIELYCATRLHNRIIELVLTRGLTSEQITVLFRAIRSEILPLHPNIRLSENSNEE